MQCHRLCNHSWEHCKARCWGASLGHMEIHSARGSDCREFAAGCKPRR